MSDGMSDMVYEERIKSNTNQINAYRAFRDNPFVIERIRNQIESTKILLVDFMKSNPSLTRAQWAYIDAAIVELDDCFKEENA